MEQKEISENKVDKVEQRKNKLKNWIKNPYNLAFLGVILFALVIRIYYFSLTKTQPMWWDEAEYMSMAQNWAFGYRFPFAAVRPILLSLIYSVFLKISNTEFLPRFFMFLLSILAVTGTYSLGKEIYNKKIGLLASFFMSVFYVGLFYTNRILVEIPSLTFFTFSALFFYKYIKNKSPKNLYFTALMLGIATLFKISNASFAIIAFIFLLITEKFRFFKKKEVWISLLLFVLILSPYIVWGYFQFGGFVLTQAGGYNLPKGYILRATFSNLKSYFTQSPLYFSWPLLIFFVLGIASMYKLILGFDLILKDKQPELRKSLYLFLLILIPLIIVSVLLQHPEDRYIITIFSAAFIVASVPILRIFNIVKKRNKFVAFTLLFILLAGVAFLQLQTTDSLTKTKLNSYVQVKEAGLWLKENTPESTLIMTRSRPQINYYSERNVTPFSEEQEEFEQALEELKPDFLMLSVYEPHRDWMYPYPQQHPEKFTPVKAYYLDEQRTQSSLIIYKINY